MNDCTCKCHEKVECATALMPTAKKQRKPRQKSEKPPSAAQLAAREKFSLKMKKYKELKAQHPDWSKEQIKKEVW